MKDDHPLIYVDVDIDVLWIMLYLNRLMNTLLMMFKIFLRLATSFRSY